VGPSDALPQFRPALGLVRAAAMPGPRASTSYDDDGQSEHGCGLLGCQSAEETHLNQAGLSRIMARQLIQGVINSNREKGQQYFEPNESTSQAFARLCQGGVVSSQLGHAEYRDGAHASGSGKDCGEIAGREKDPRDWNVDVTFDPEGVRGYYLRLFRAPKFLLERSRKHSLSRAFAQFKAAISVAP